MLFYARGFAPCIPAPEPARHWLSLRCRNPAGGAGGWLPDNLALPVPGGGARRFWSPAYPAFSLLFCPHPPDPLPGGKGGIFSFLMQGAKPLASPGLNPGGTGAGGEPRTQRGA